MIIPTVSLPHYPARPCRPQGGFGLVMMMMMITVMMMEMKMISAGLVDNGHDYGNDDDRLL